MSLKCLSSRSRELNSIPREKIKSYETTIVSYFANTYPFFSIKNKYLDILIFVSFYKNDYGSSRKQKKSLLLLLLKTPSLHVIYCLLWEERRGFRKECYYLRCLVKWLFFSKIGERMISLSWQGAQVFQCFRTSLGF